MTKCYAGCRGECRCYPQAHEALCTCTACRMLDKRHPAEGHQLAMFEQRTQHVPTEGEALRSLFELAGKSTAFDRTGQRAMIL